jgi:uncharacterized protein (TIGR02453 family)
MPDTRFVGFPAAAVTFYRELEAHNAKPWWEAHKATYEAACRAPMQALLDELEEEFGASRMMRPYRDIRFSADKSPYKTNCAATIGDGWYVGLSSNGLYVGGGRYDLDGPALARYREAAAADASGRELDAILAKLRRAGYEVEGEQLKSGPRGTATDHPRIALLRYKSLFAGRHFAPGAIELRTVLQNVRKVLHDLAPLVSWLDAHVGSEMAVARRA